MKNLDKYWEIFHSPDESGNRSQVTYIKTTWVGDIEAQRLEDKIMQDYCYRTYGQNLMWNKGTPKQSWVLVPSTLAGYNQAKPLNFPDSQTVPNMMHITIGHSNGGMALAKK